MASTPIRKALKTVATEGLRAKPWFNKFPDGVEGWVTTYACGEEVTLDPNSTSLGIVISGCIEICDQSRLEAKYLAYRPIRLVGPNEFFGEFPIADKTLALPPPLTGEKWKLFAGHHSMIVLDRINRLDRFLEEEPADHLSPHLFIRTTSTDRPTSIILIDRTDLFERGHLVFHEVLCTAWEKAHAYRAGLNSYNLSDLFAFRKIVARQWSEESKREDRKVEKVNSNGDVVKNYIHPRGRLHQKDLQAIFADALFDALHRPLRGDPMFASAKDVLSTLCEQELFRLGGDISNVLVARGGPDYKVDTFYYPMDLYNFEINSYCGENGLQTEAKEALGWDRGDESNKARKFFITLIGRVLGQWEAENRAKISRAADGGKRTSSEYPFVVSCCEKDCLSGKVILLQFDRKGGPT